MIEQLLRNGSPNADGIQTANVWRFSKLVADPCKTSPSATQLRAPTLPPGSGPLRATVAPQDAGQDFARQGLSLIHQLFTEHEGGLPADPRRDQGPRQGNPAGRLAAQLAAGEALQQANQALAGQVFGAELGKFGEQ